MVEQADACKCHCHIVFVASFNHMVITYGATRLCNVADATLMCAFYNYLRMGRMRLILKLRLSLYPAMPVFLHVSALPAFL